MESDQELATPEQLDQLARALHVISRPALRRAFLSDPHATLTANGAEYLPEALVDVLAHMSYEELSLVARLWQPEHGIGIGTMPDGGVFRFL
ncbi:MAG: hypothetical protein M3252_07210 [Actinomycetota bacterium]|nr:hypothetical protein [Actinomycetota bacterium]